MLHRIIARIPTGPEPKTTPTRPGFHLVWLVCFTAKLMAVTTIFVLLLGNSANATVAYEPSVDTTRHGVLIGTGLRDCRVASSVPCTLFGGIDSGWLDSSYTWHSVWMHQPRGHWHWATKAERSRFGLDMTIQVQRRHGRITWFRGPTGEAWANVPGEYDSEHWPEGQAPL